MEVSEPPKHCLVVSDGRRGIENQALGLAEGLARRLELTINTLHLPRSGQVPPLEIKADLWIGCGRAAVRALEAHRRALPNARFVYVQDPRTRHDRFDLIIAPRHDQLSGANVFNIVGSPNRITAERLTEEAHAFADRLADYPSPRVALLIGGDSKHHRFTEESCAYLLELVERLKALAGSILITPSRRSPESFRQALTERFGDDRKVWLHHDDEPNPYFAFLQGADWICVTEDSTNMLCEAASTGKPVYRLGIDGKPGKFERLYAGLEARGAVRPFLGTLDRWTYEPLRETERAAEAVLALFST